MPTTVLTERTRMTWMDAVRGTAIILLLIWHASAVPALYGVEMPEVIRSANAFFLPFRMPTLMLLSGMLLERSLRKPLPRYLAGKASMVVWPYLVWVVIAKLTFLEQAGLPWWHWRAWYATSYLWFLFFIAVYYAAAPLLRHLPIWATVGLAALGAILLDAGSMEQRMAYFAVFFFGGAWLARHPALLDRTSRPRMLVLLGIPAVAFGVASVLLPDALHHLLWGAPLSIAGSLALIGIFSTAGRHGLVRRLVEFLGRSSIVFYVSHFPVMALLSQSPLADGGALVLAVSNVMAAMLIGVALSVGKSQVPIAWLFRAPGPLTDALTASLSRLSGASRRRVDETGGTTESRAPGRQSATSE